MTNLSTSTDQIDRAIRQHRATTATVTLTHNGSPLAQQEVIVKQTRHQFLFGSNWGESSIALANGELSGHDKELAERRNENFLRLFNQATLPFYWGRFEPLRGKPETARLMKAAKWLAERGVAVGALLGTAYLFTQEAVESGAIVPRYSPEEIWQLGMHYAKDEIWAEEGVSDAAFENWIFFFLARDFQ